MTRKCWYLLLWIGHIQYPTAIRISSSRILEHEQTKPFWRAAPRAMMMARRFGYVAGGTLAAHHVIKRRREEHRHMIPQFPISDLRLQDEVRRSILYGVLSGTDSQFEAAMQIDDIDSDEINGAEVACKALGNALDKADEKLEMVGEEAHQMLLKKDVQLFGPLIGAIVTELEEEEMTALMQQFPGVQEAEQAGNRVVKIGNQAKESVEEMSALVESLHLRDGHPDFNGAGAHLWKIVQLVESMAIGVGKEAGHEIFEDVADIAKEVKAAARAVNLALDLNLQLPRMKVALKDLREAHSPQAQKLAISQLGGVVSKILLSLDHGLPDDMGLLDDGSSRRYVALHSKLHRVADAANAISSSVTYRKIGEEIHFMIGDEDITADVEAMRKGNFTHVDKKHLDNMLRAADKVLHAGGIVAGSTARESIVTARKHLQKWTDIVDVVLPDDGPLISAISTKVIGDQPHIFIGREDITSDLEALRHGKLDHLDKNRVVSLLNAAQHASHIGASLSKGDARDTFEKAEERAEALKELANVVLPVDGTIITTKAIEDRTHFFIGSENVTAALDAIKAGGLWKVGKDGINQLEKKHVDNLLIAISKAMRAGAVIAGGNMRTPLSQAEEHVDHLRDVANNALTDNIGGSESMEACSDNDAPEQCLSKTYFSSAGVMYRAVVGNYLPWRWHGSPMSYFQSQTTPSQETKVEKHSKANDTAID